MSNRKAFDPLRHMWPLIIALVALTCGKEQVMAQAKTIKGVVFEDTNRNGRQDQNESGIPEVMVSNQREVVLTDKQGRYQLPLMSRTIIFITKPSGYAVPLNKNQQAKFFYIHQPQGSPEGLKYSGIKPTGPIPTSLDFPLYKAESTDQFDAIIVGDPQPRDIRELGYFRDDIVSEMINREASFYIAYGDIAFDDLSLYQEYNQIVGTLGIPAYNVHGNHDMNYDVPHDSLATETFKRHFGPADYSFNYGKVHFVVLDNVAYSGWNYETKSHGSYIGQLNEKQLTWIKNDLANTPEEYLVVINTHIPLKTTQSDAGSINTVNKEALFKILESRQHLLALSAHMHYIDHLTFTQQDGWMGNATFHNLNVGAGCGAWWSGPKDTRGIPVSYSLDGSPNGFYMFNFNGNNFNYHYVPANAPEHQQMRISFPNGNVVSDSLVNKSILVNIFNADPDAQVYCRLDNGVPLVMKQQYTQDPFIVEYLKDGDNFPDWSNRALTHQHMWAVPLPADLAPGTHSLKVKATDSKGNSYQGFTIFKVLP